MEQAVFLATKVLWSQLDPNGHLRHSAYADLAAQARLQMMVDFGFDENTLRILALGPILFREETIYHKEVRANETVQVTCLLKRCREDAARWSFEQQVLQPNGQVAATISVDGAWIDLIKRKLVVPPKEIANSFLARMPRTDDFQLDVVAVKYKQ